MKTQKRQTGIAWLMCLLFLVLMVFPLYIMLKTSVSPPQEVFRPRPSYGISAWTGEHYARVFASGETFYGPLRKSIITACAVTVLSLFISIPAAYATARFPVRIRYVLVLLMFVGRMMPEVSIALPIAIRFIQMGLYDTIPGLVLAHLIRVLPVSAFILVSVFGAMPPELEEQARIDGCTRLQAIRRVVLPLSLPGVAVAALFAFLLSWDEFIYASYLTLSRPTMPLQMYYYVSRGSLFHAATYAVLITVPVLLATFALQRYIKPEYLAGAVKG